MSINRTDPINIAAGVVDFYDAYGDLVSAANPIELGIAGRGAPDNLIHRRLDPKGLYTGGSDSHDTRAVRYLKQFGGDRFLIVEAINGTPGRDPGHFPTLSCLAAMIMEGIPVITEPFASNSLLGWQGTGSVKDFLDKGDTLYACEYHTEASTPAMICTIADPRPWPHTIIGFDGPYREDLAGLDAHTGAASWAGPIVASAAGLLRLVRPDVSAIDIVSLLLETAPVVNGKRMLNVFEAGKELLGSRSVPSPTPTPEPQPQPEPQPMNDIWTSPHRWNDRRGEGLDEGFDGDPLTKALTFRDNAILKVESDKTHVEAICYITANDVPDRDIARIELVFKNGTQQDITVEPIEERLWARSLDTSFDATQLERINLFNVRGSILQFAGLELIEGKVVPEPTPEPEPEPEPEPLTLEERVTRIEEHLGL